MFNRITPVVRNLILANVIIYFIIENLPPELKTSLMIYNPLLPNNPDPINPNFKIWQIITSMFLHADYRHLFSNMFGLFMFGSMLESYMGGKRFFIYYMLCGLGATIIMSLVNYYELSQFAIDSPEYLNGGLSRSLGASGAIFGILGAFGFLFPNIEMSLLFVPFPLKAKYFVTLYGIYELFQGTIGFNDGIGHFAHIGGLVTGLILLKFFNFGKQKGLF
jgi:membrane associated rhomboid family serine protease